VKFPLRAQLLYRRWIKGYAVFNVAWTNKRKVTYRWNWTVTKTRARCGVVAVEASSLIVA